MRERITDLILGVFFILSFFLYYIDIAISPRTLFLVFFAGFAFFILRKKPPVNKLMFILFIFASYSFSLDIFLFSKPLIQSISTFVLAFIVPYLTVYLITALIDSEKKLKNCVSMVIIITFINAVFVIGQFFEIDFFWKLRYFLFPYAMDMTRPAGLTAYVIDLSYQLVLFVPLSFINFSNKVKIKHLLIPLILILASIFSLTRTCAFAVLLTYIIFMFSRHYKVNRFVTFAIFLIIGMCIPVMLNTVDVDRLLTYDDESAEMRLPLFTTAIHSMVKYPLGLTKEEYTSVWGTSTTAHNQFLNTGVFYGVPSLILLLYFTYIVFRNSYQDIKSHKDKRKALLNYLFFLSLIGFTFNSLFHNSGFFMSNSEVYIIIGLMIAYRKLQRNKMKKALR